MGKKGEDDPRFAAFAKDPRFARFPKKQHKVKIDSRFKGAPAAVHSTPTAHLLSDTALDL